MHRKCRPNRITALDKFNTSPLSRIALGPWCDETAFFDSYFITQFVKACVVDVSGMLHCIDP